MLKTLGKISSTFLVLGFLMTGISIYRKIEYEQIKTQGIETSAIVTRKMTRTRKKWGRERSKNYFFYIEFFDENKVEQATKIDVDREIFDKIDNNPVIKIKYLEQSPKSAFAPSYSQDPMEYLQWWIIITISGGVGLIFLRNFYKLNKG